MTRVLQFILPIFFLVLGTGILIGWVFPGLPPGTGMREMLGVVTVLFGLYRGAVFFFAPPGPRRPYGGIRKRFLGQKEQNHESKTP